MRKTRLIVPLFLAALIAVLLRGPVRAQAGPNDRGALPEYSDLTPAQQYAAEILSCLLRIVLGESGNPKYREAWKTRGVDRSLPDLDEVYAIMKDSDRNELALMVLDPNLRFLTRVLYHYDERLSLHKGADIVAVYPAPEFVALRLLILKKMQRGEKIRLGELVRRKGLLRLDAEEPSQDALLAMGLRREELHLVRQVLDREPHLYAYLHSPFLVKALWEVGVLANDAFTARKVRQAHYGDIAAHSQEAFEGNERGVNVAVLPSLITAFETSESALGPSGSGFRPTEEYWELVQGLVESIRRSVDGPIRFFLHWNRPLLIYPENAEQVIGTVTPGADFTIVLLDKNLYLPLHIEEQDVYPRVPWTYLDILDLEYDQAEDSIQEIAVFLRGLLERRGF